MNKAEVVQKVTEILSDECDSPSEELRRLGQAMISIANALEDQPVLQAKRIMKSVAILLDIDLSQR